MAQVTIVGSWSADIDQNGAKFATEVDEWMGGDGTGSYRVPIRFDLTTLPTDATVTQVQLRVQVLTVVSAAALLWDIDGYNGDGITGNPETDAGATAYTRCNVAGVYVNDTTQFRTTGQKILDLGATAVSDVQAARAAGTLYSVAIRETTDTFSTAHSDIASVVNGTAGNRPALIIDYTQGGAGATITDVGTDEIIDDLQQNVVITGTAFGATQGTGKVEIGDNSTYASATKVQLPVDSWADTSITVDFQNITGGTAISLVLRTRPLYLFVTPNGGAASAAFPITLNDSDPYLKSLDEGLSMMSGLTPGTKPTGIVAHWHFDDPSGTTLEDRWRTHNGSLVNTPTLAQTALPPTSARSSMFFDSSQSEYAQVTHNAAFASATGAISGWFKPNSLANNSVVLSKNGSTPAAGDIRLKYDANGQITFSVWNATPTELTIQSPTGYVAVGQTVHFQIIWDNTGFELWLDGNEVGTKITSYTSGLTANTTRAWRFGAAGA